MANKTNMSSARALRSKFATGKAGKRVNAKVTKAQRRATVLKATSRVKTDTPVDVAKVLRG